MFYRMYLRRDIKRVSYPRISLSIVFIDLSHTVLYLLLTHHLYIHKIKKEGRRIKKLHKRNKILKIRIKGYYL